MTRSNRRGPPTDSLAGHDEGSQPTSAPDSTSSTPLTGDLAGLLQGQTDILRQLGAQVAESRRVSDLLQEFLLAQHPRPTEREPLSPAVGREPRAASTRGEAPTHSAGQPYLYDPRAPTVEPLDYRGPEVGYPYVPRPYAAPREATRESTMKIKPPEWDGNEETLEDFIDQCKLNFEANPHKYPTDQAKITLAVGNMSGTPRTRIRNLRSSGEYFPFLHDWELFCNDLRSSYGDPNPGVTARLQLISLKQKGPVTAHAAEFRSLAARANATDEQQLLTLFEQSLRRSLRDRLIHVPLDNMRNFIKAAVDTERRTQIIHKTPGQISASTAAPRPRREQTTTFVKRERTSPAPRNPGRESADRLRQDRKAAGKCFGCGGDHYLRDCPKAAQTQMLRAHAVVYDEGRDWLVNPLDGSDEESDPPADLSAESASEPEN